MNLLRLTQKTGRLAIGFDIVRIPLSKNRAKLIFVGSDMGQNTRDRLAFLMRKKDVKLVNALSGAEMTQAPGKKRKLVSVTDAGLSKAMIKNLDEGM